MTSRKEILNVALEKAQNKANKLEDIYLALKQENGAEYKKVLEAYFGEVLIEGDTLSVNSYYGEISMDIIRPIDSRNNRILSVNFYTSGYMGSKEQYGDFLKISTNFYSTNDSSSYELQRMITIGKVGEIILDYSDDILAVLNTIKSRFEDKVDQAGSDSWKAQKEVDKITEQIRKVDQENRLEKLSNEGLSFNWEAGSFNTPELVIKYNRSASNISFIQLLGTTASGKSGRVKFVQKYNSYKLDKVEEVTRESIETIKMDNIIAFLNKYSNKSISA